MGKNKIKKLKPIAFCLAASALLLLCSSGLLYAGQDERVYRKSKVLMDTFVNISAVSDSSEKADAAIGKAFSEIEKIDRLINFFSDKSELSEINREAGIKPVIVSPETIELIEKAVFASQKTGGAFDITMGPEIVLWDFFKKVKPEDAAIRERLPLVDYKRITINKKASTVFLNKKGMIIDLGGAAKGFAADKAAEVMKQNGIKSGIVAIAGDIKTFGLKPGSKPWNVGIKNPRMKSSDDEIMATIELSDMAISTSGDYERYFIVDNKRYHHILDPKTGYPASECRSVSIIAKDGSLADPFATGVFVLGPEKGLKLLEEMGIGGIIVDKDGKIHMTRNLRGKVEFKKSI